jgi:hypothetical protein
LTTALPPHGSAIATCRLISTRTRRPCRGCQGGRAAATNVPDELDQPRPNLLRKELVACGVGVHTVALEHGVGEACRTRAVCNDNGRLCRSLL